MHHKPLESDNIPNNPTMAREQKALLTCIISILFTSLTLFSVMASSQALKGAYFASWASLTPSAINTNLFTHIYYAFLIPNDVTFEFTVDNAQASQLLNLTSTLHTRNPPAQALFSVGGGSAGSVLFANMAANPSNRNRFIMSSIQVARQYGFDGIDLDWEYPGTPVDMVNLGHLLDEWRVEVQREAASTRRSPLLLTAAVYYSSRMLFDGPQRSYPSASVGQNLDWINIMNYDYRGSWDTTATGAPAALFDPNSNISTSYGLRSWIQSGVPRSKLIMGLPLYGRTWRLRDPAMHGIGAAAIGVGPGPEGTMTYAEIVQFNRERNATQVYDSVTVSAYSVAGDSWIGYDDVRTVSEKIRYARELGIRGYFFWVLHGDYQWEISTTASNLW